MQIYTDAHTAAPKGLSVEALGSPDEKYEEYTYGHIYQLHHGNDFQAIQFQRGPVKEHGVNGTTNEALIAVIAHRLEYLDSKFPCAENKQAIEHLGQALQVLESRTAKRVAGGVEGTNQHLPEDRVAKPLSEAAVMQLS